MPRSASQITIRYMKKSRRFGLVGLCVIAVGLAILVARDDEPDTSPELEKLLADPMASIVLDRTTLLEEYTNPGHTSEESMLGKPSNAGITRTFDFDGTRETRRAVFKQFRHEALAAGWTEWGDNKRGDDCHQYEQDDDSAELLTIQLSLCVSSYSDPTGHTLVLVMTGPDMG